MLQSILTESNIYILEFVQKIHIHTSNLVLQIFIQSSKLSSDNKKSGHDDLESTDI